MSEHPIGSPERIHQIEARLAALETTTNQIREKQEELYREKNGLQEQVTDLTRQMHNLRNPTHNVVEVSPGHVEVDGRRYMLEEGGERSA
jgi:hypothetical protein